MHPSIERLFYPYGSGTFHHNEHPRITRYMAGRASTSAIVEATMKLVRKTI